VAKGDSIPDRTPTTAAYCSRCRLPSWWLATRSTIQRGPSPVNGQARRRCRVCRELDVPTLRTDRLFPTGSITLTSYDLAGGLGEPTILAYAIHFSDREITRLTEQRNAISRIARRRTSPGERRNATGPLTWRRASPLVCARTSHEIASLLILRSHPNLVRAASVHGRRLDGPPNA
jgi:hypothetical protein